MVDIKMNNYMLGSYWQNIFLIDGLQYLAELGKDALLMPHLLRLLLVKQSMITRQI